ncbi:hypothetical protein HYH03_003220 [Edaphochlamys debaryana]|uniref:Uncharacterized protein n=1 Tax=Edaphochlamys debaryana TaxID=47281 RepID=A0A835Y9W5_9CHLO|nr:hypothetical protein HYH03_003220 [Edaphochlamys debaryana]|eukprot:KAG2499035.1 hypothetical protein HYH03_003220 [Edaphochlamys debaryana]
MSATARSQAEPERAGPGLADVLRVLSVDAATNLLPGIEVLSEKLTRLVVGDAALNVIGDSTLGPEALGSISQLLKLRTLRLHGLLVGREGAAGERSGLLGLLNDPPPGLECLELWDCRAYVPPSHQEQHLEAAVQLQAGRITCLELSSISEAAVLPAVIRDVILPCKALGTWLELGTPPPVLRLRSVLVDGLASNAEASKPLQQLLQRCALLDPAHELRVGPHGTAADVTAALQALGSAWMLSLSGFPGDRFSIHVGPDAADQLPYDNADSDADADPEPASPLPDAGAVLHFAVQRLALIRATHPQVVVGRDTSRFVLLLAGHAAERLAGMLDGGVLLPWGREALEAALCRLMQRLRHRLGVDNQALRGAQAVPAASVVLLECGESDGVLLSVEALAEAAMDEGFEAPVLVPLEAAPRARVRRWDGRRLPERGRPFASHEALRWGLQQVMEEAWNVAADRSLRERLEWALGVRRELAKLPRFVV